MSTLKTLVEYRKNLKSEEDGGVIRISQMKSDHSSNDNFFEEICKFRLTNRKIIIQTD